MRIGIRARLGHLVVGDGWGHRVGHEVEYASECRVSTASHTAELTRRIGRRNRNPMRRVRDATTPLLDPENAAASVEPSSTLAVERAKDSGEFLTALGEVASDELGSGRRGVPGRVSEVHDRPIGGIDNLTEFVASEFIPARSRRPARCWCSRHPRRSRSAHAGRHRSRGGSEACYLLKKPATC
jgi:hypothetical protein